MGIVNWRLHMNTRRKFTLVGSVVIGPLLFISAAAFGQDEPSECVEMGALAFDNWTRSDAGGSGMPAGEVDNDYIRCKSCHGWDGMGTEGGYVRRSRNAGRPNAGAGDSDTTSRVISPFMGGHDPITADMILHAGTGRAFTDGTGSWVPLDATHSAANKAANAEGRTLGNQHPDLSADGANAGDTVLTQEQLDCLVEFLNFEDADASAYFSDINTSTNPVLYTIVDTADAAAGETFYDDTCFACHGDPAQDAAPFPFPDGGGVLSYLDGDGKFSEFAHKTRWGIPDEPMTRDAIGSPTSAEIANLMLYLQELGGTGFAVNPGLTGTWYNADREGEGFLLEFGYSNAELTLFASFYTYDDTGNQAWLVASPTGGGPVSGDSVAVDVFLVTGPMWGDDFDEADRNVVAWGTGVFTFPSCTSGHVALTPSQEGIALGFTNLEYDLTRDLLISGIECPTAP
jgi:cytochrome c553